MFLLDPKILILLLTGLINLAMSIFILWRSQKNKVNFYFGLMTLFNFLWALALIGFEVSVGVSTLRFFASLPYAMAWLVIIFLFYFAVHFPYENFRVKKIYNFLIIIFSILILLCTTVAYKFFVTEVFLKPTRVAHYNFLVYVLYTLAMVSVVVSSIFVLFSKYRKAEGIFKTQIALVLVGVIIGTLFGCYFNLFLMFVNNFDYIYLGPLFTLFINFIVLGFIVSSKEKING